MSVFLQVHATLLEFESKSLLDASLEIYAKHLVKTPKGYLRYQVDALCDTGKELHDCYAARLAGYYTAQQLAEKLASGKSAVSQAIVTFTESLHTADDFVRL